MWPLRTSAIRASVPELLAANARDLEAARAKGTSGAMLDRLALDAKRVEAMAKGVEEIAARAVFLASKETGYITGQTHVIDGGWTAR